MSIVQAILASISSGSVPASISVYGWSDPMNEGQTNTAYIQYENYPSTIIYWQIFNDTTNTLDWGGNINPAGFLVIEGTGQQSFSWTTTADMATEGSQNYYLQVGTTSGGTDILNQYLTINDTSVPAKANFTIEWWQKVENNNTNARPWSVGLYSTQVIAVSYESMAADYYWINNGIVGNVSRNHVTGSWEHMAFVRNNGVVKGYINGQEYFSGNNNAEITDTTTPLYVGTGELGAGTYRGYIKDLHIIKGVAKYTGNFSVPYLPATQQTGSVFLLSAMNDGTKYNDTVGSKSGSLTGTVTYSEDDPWTYPGATFTAGGYGNNLITPNPMPANLRTGLKVSDGLGWSDYIINPNYFGNIQLLSLPSNPSYVDPYTVSEETNPLTIYINYGGSGGGVSTIEGRFSQYPATVALSAVRAGWTYLDPNGNTGTITSDAYISGSSVFLNVPSATLGSWTFTPPNYGGSLYFNGSSYINYGGSADWAMDV